MLLMVNQYEEKDNCKRAKRDFEKLKENLGKPMNQNNFVAFPYHIFWKIISLVLISLELQQLWQWQNLSKENLLMTV